MKRNLQTSLWAIAILLVANTSLTSCDDDSKDRYISYGLVDAQENNKYLIHLDDGTTVRPVNVNQLKDCLRVIMDFSIVDENDTIGGIKYNVEINAIKEVPVEYIQPYDEATADTIGNDPVEIHNGECWLANGFLTIEFFCTGLSYTQHEVYMFQHPTSDGTIALEFRHDNGDEPQRELRRSNVSFPITELVEGLEKPVTINVQYLDGDNKTQNIELTYK